MADWEDSTQSVAIVSSILSVSSLGFGWTLYYGY